MTFPTVSATASVFAILCSPAVAQRGDLTWHTDLTTARALAAEQHKPLFVVFRCEN